SNVACDTEICARSALPRTAPRTKLSSSADARAPITTETSASGGNEKRCTESQASSKEREASLRGASIHHSRSYNHFVPLVTNSALPSIPTADGAGGKSA